MDSSATESKLQSRSQSGEHNGARWTLTLTKSNMGFYGAEAVIRYPEPMGGHEERIDWSDGTRVAVVEGVLRKIREGERFSNNPYKQCVDQIIGAIDARHDASKARPTLLGMLADTYKETTLRTALELSKKGSDLPMRAIFIGRALELALIDKQHRKTIEESKMAINPSTNPTPEQLKAMQKAVNDLIARFSIAGIAYLGGYDRQVVSNWKGRGRVSAQAANDLCKIREIKEAGFTRENLRPDVPFWYVD